MRKFVTLDCLIDSNESLVFPSDAIQNLRQALLAPVTLKPNILESLHKNNFRFHRTCSYSNIIRECNVGEGQTLLMFWGSGGTDSRVTMSESLSTSSFPVVMVQSNHSAPRECRVQSTGQQTEISCRHSSGITSPAPRIDTEEHRILRARIADSLTFSSPATSILSPTAPGRSMSILGSVCALLLSKPGSSAAPKQVSSFIGSPNSDNICRICFGGESSEKLVRPCSCRGTIAAVHRSCLERWLLQAATSYCELCRHHYVVTRSHKDERGCVSRASVARPWRKSEGTLRARRRAFPPEWQVVVGAVAGGVGAVGARAQLHACDRVLQLGARRGGSAALAANLFSSLLIGIIGALNGLLTTWILLKIQEHQLSWQTWRDSTLHVHVTLADEETLTPSPSDLTIVGDDTGLARIDRSTNIADPFMVAPPTDT